MAICAIGPATQRGVALVLVLWVIVLLSVIGGSHARNVHVEMRLARNQLDAAQARALAEAGLNHAILELFVSNTEDRWLFDGTLYQLDFGIGTAQVAVRNASGLVDLNAASPQLLRTLLQIRGIDEATSDELVDAILDWRDADDLVRLHGAEDRDYRFAGRSYGTPDRDFETLDELRYVLGVTGDVFRALAPYLTLYSRTGAVNPEFAPPLLREKLFGVAAADAEADSEVAMQVPEAPEPSAGPSPVVSAEAGEQQSTSFHVSVKASVNGGASATLDVVVNTAPAGSQAYSIVSWREVATEEGTADG